MQGKGVAKLILAILIAAGTTRADEVVRFVGGKAYHPESDPKWTTLEGEVWTLVPEGMILRQVTHNGRYLPPDVDEVQSIGAHVAPNSGEIVGRKYGKFYLVKNYHGGTLPSRGAQIRCLAMPVGMVIVAEEKIEAWDCGIEQNEANNTPPDTWKPRVRAVLDLSNGGLRIKNAGGSQWPVLNLILTAFDGTEFTNSIAPLKGGAISQIPLTNFVNQAGDRASPDMKFKKASIGGNGFQFGACRL